MKDLRGFHIDLQNCIFQENNENNAILNIFLEKLKNLTEFRFMINYDYSLSNNKNYQEILLKIMKQFLIPLSHLEKLELILGLSNFDLFDVSSQISKETQFFSILSYFHISLANILDNKQIKALGLLINLMPSLKTLIINFLNHDMRKLSFSNEKPNEKIVFDRKMAQNLSNISLLKDLEVVSIVFEDKIYKEFLAFEHFLSFFLGCNNLQVFELDGSNLIKPVENQDNCENLLKILKNNDNIKKLSIKLAYNELNNDVLIRLFNRIGGVASLMNLALDMEFSKINNFLLKKLSNSLKSLKKLKILHLNLSKNRIRQQGCQDLSNSLAHLPSLTSLFLDLSFNTVLDEGLIEICGNIPRNLCDFMLFIERNGISLEGVKGLQGKDQAFNRLRKIYMDLLNNESIGKEGNYILMKLFEGIALRNSDLADVQWESDYLEGDDKRLKIRKNALNEYLLKKKILVAQFERMKCYKKILRRDLRIDVIIEKFVKKTKNT